MRHEDSDLPDPNGNVRPSQSTNYEVIRELGRGAMGVVYEGWDRQTKRRVALKHLLKVGPDPKRLERFRREGEIAASLVHPGIVRLYSATLHQGLPCLVYELVPGARSLSEEVRGVDLPTRLRLVTEVAQAVGHAHACGVTHRDLKPDNVLVGEDGHPRVTDFGIALSYSHERLTQTGALVGTPHYMSPEQFAGGAQVGPRSDVWALGVVLYETLCGRRPFEGATLMDLYGRIHSGRVVPLGERAPGLPSGVESVCRRALQVNPTQRYSNAGEFADALQACLRGEGAGPGTRRPWLWWVAAGVACILALSLGTRALRSHGPSRSGERRNSLKLVLNPEPTWGEELKVSGTASPRINRVRVSAGKTIRHADVVNGAFHVSLRLAPGAYRVRVEALNEPQTFAEGDAELRLPPDWYQGMRPRTRPSLPLPSGFGFGEAEGDYVNLRDGSLLVWVREGTLTLGRPNPLIGVDPREVSVSGFFLGKNEVSRGQWSGYCEATGALPLPTRLVNPEHEFADFFPGKSEAEANSTPFSLTEEHPALYVSWNQARAYCAWAGLRLPHDAEWEYAARGDTGRLYPWGDEADVTRFNGESGLDGYPYAAPVGSFPNGASPFGCLDMAGNAAEWTLDPFVSDDGEERWAVRGGSWLAVPFVCQSVYRDGGFADQRRRSIGFRVAR